MFQQAADARYGLGLTDMKTLSILLREGLKIAGEIGNRLGLTSGSVMVLADRLESKALVQRQAHPHDRRKVVIAVNQATL